MNRAWSGTDPLDTGSFQTRLAFLSASMLHHLWDAMHRRSFMQTVGVAAAAATAAAPPPADAQTAGNGKLKIGAVEIWKVEGHQETLRGVDHQAPVF